MRWCLRPSLGLWNVLDHRGDCRSLVAVIVDDRDGDAGVTGAGAGAVAGSLMVVVVQVAIKCVY